MITAHRAGHAALVEQLHQRGLLDDTWRDVWYAVPREPFIPQQAWRQEATRCVPLTTEDEWLTLIHADEPVVIQVDDGRADGPGIATSSNSQPSMVARMLMLLAVEDGHRVLEIGTASGHLAALLSCRLGDDHVYSIEVDEGLATHAARALHAVNLQPHLACADGQWGWPAPHESRFDRIVVTCALRHIPHALVQQLRYGGVLVAPMARDFWSGALVRLTAHGDGTAEGRFHGGASYMPMRSHRQQDAVPVDDSTARRYAGVLAPRELLSLGFALYAGARLPGVRMWHSGTDPDVRVWLQDEKGSAATAGEEDVWQYGARDLWREVERVHAEYVRLGCPGHADFGLTVTPGGEGVWLRSPARILDALVHPGG
ncbi:methyltransferase domain-containing protein [Streptomyces coeruleoprunus]|uniref:Protein-L-isoaspartate O-methyltransferase n=1 Tax=Streptomyces coeruleoprunus TaxID=285563 RepID=A0ABV9XSA6_9ACTN